MYCFNSYYNGRMTGIKVSAANKAAARKWVLNGRSEPQPPDRLHYLGMERKEAI